MFMCCVGFCSWTNSLFNHKFFWNFESHHVNLKSSRFTSSRPKPIAPNHIPTTTTLTISPNHHRLTSLPLHLNSPLPPLSNNNNKHKHKPWPPPPTPSSSTSTSPSQPSTTKNTSASAASGARPPTPRSQCCSTSTRRSTRWPSARTSRCVWRAR